MSVAAVCAVPTHVPSLPACDIAGEFQYGEMAREYRRCEENGELDVPFQGCEPCRGLLGSSASR